MARTRYAAFAAAALLAVGLVGCADSGTGPSPSASASPTASGTPSSSPTASPTPSASPSVSADITLPASCEQIYSAGMLAQLNAENPPLNDPGVTMDSTGIEDIYYLLQDLTAAGDTIRCSWGMPSEFGLATNVSIVTPEQAETVIAASRAGGLDCADYRMGTICRIVVENDDDSGSYAYGETHFLAGNGWVSTGWLNFGPAGYTEDIVATLWG